MKRMLKSTIAVLALGCAVGLVNAQTAMAVSKPPVQKQVMTSTDSRVEKILSQMTTDEKLKLVYGYFGINQLPKYKMPDEARYGSAGYVAGVQRLNIPPQWQTDAGIGVATQHDAEPERRLGRTALPSGIASAATWDPNLAYKGGQMIGAEARQSGFNVMLAGGVNLLREPRNGRNFEYGGEDPLLAGTMVGAHVHGIQSNQIISTIKHFAINDQETGRFVMSSNIDPDQARMSDLLAFQIALEKSDAGSVMCAYNRVNTTYSCENAWLLTDVLKGDFGFKGYVMTDWGAGHSTAPAALAGLDQESAAQSFDKELYFGPLLKTALEKGTVPMSRLDDMARRILWAMVHTGLMDNPVKISAIDFDKNAKITREGAEEAIVLLKNERDLLPLTTKAKTIAVIGSHADVGVLSGGGSAQVYPVKGMAVPNLGPKEFPGPIVYFPSSPLKALQARLPGAKIVYDEGTDPLAAAKLAKSADVVIVFANQWTAEMIDASIHLGAQDTLISEVAKANANTVVVLENGGPVLMPWIKSVGAVVEAWFPGSEGGEAIANVLTGQVNPSGRLPVSFPVDESQLPRPVLDGDPKTPEVPFDVHYSEGATVGYKWFDKKGLNPLFPFGYGLSYTSFGYNQVKALAKNNRVTLTFSVTNTGKRAGKATPQVYMSPKAGGWEAPKRLVGFAKLDLKPGETKSASVTVDPRLLATFSSAAKGWTIAAGEYEVMLGASSRDLKTTTTVKLNQEHLPANARGN